MSEIITNIDNTIYSYRNYILKEDENNLYLNNGYFYELINNDVNTKDATIYNYEQYGNRCGFASALNAFRFFGMKDIDILKRISYLINYNIIEDVNNNQADQRNILDLLVKYAENHNLALNDGHSNGEVCRLGFNPKEKSIKG